MTTHTLLCTRSFKNTLLYFMFDDNDTICGTFEAEISKDGFQRAVAHFSGYQYVVCPSSSCLNELLTAIAEQSKILVD